MTAATTPSWKRRRDLAERIAGSVQVVKEYGEGSEYATDRALSHCKQIAVDVAELRTLLEERMEAIKGADRVKGVIQSSAVYPNG